MNGGAIRALWPAAPLLVWGAHFGLVYGLHAHACERGLDEAALRIAVGIATAVAILLLLLARPLRAVAALEAGEEAGHFARWLAAAAALVSGLAILFQASPVFVLPACQ